MNPLVDNTTGSVPGVTTFVLGETSLEAVFYPDQIYTATFQAPNNPIAVEIRKANDQSSKQAIRYQDLLLPSGVTAQIKLTPQGIELLRYDSNGDGTFDTEVLPTASVTGPVANDTEAPIINVNALGQGTTLEVTLSAQDNGSGVRSLSYSLDGTNFQPYTTSLSVSPVQNPLLYAFADDNVANRSGLVTLRLAPELTPLSQAFDASGGTSNLSVSAINGFNWSANSGEGWITINSGSGVGNGSIAFSVAPNASASTRSGTITLAGQTFAVLQGAAFLDVPSNYPFYNYIGKLSARGVTLGCGGSNYCPESPVTREQMAAFIIRALGMPNPPTPSVQRFADVPPSNQFYPFIEELASRGITLGCGTNAQGEPLYCPSSPVTREQMSAFILRALGEFNPAAPSSQRFDDVTATNIFYAFIERMAQLQITLGCSASPPLYCPSGSVTRGQMAAFLVRAFGV